jgi:CubicO group peptidase (beta-lactamase class C family)
MAGILVSTAVAVFSQFLGLNNEVTVPLAPYLNIIEEFGLTPQSSDASIEQAMHAMSEKFSKTCEAGWVLGVTRNGRRVIVSEGVLKVGEDRPVTEDTLFEIGSVSKPLTALVLAQQIVEGLVTLETPINDMLPDWIPDLTVDGEKVTFKRLVTHTAGFPEFPDLLPYLVRRAMNPYTTNPFENFSEVDFLHEIEAATGQMRQSTGKWEYSSFAFSVLAYILGKNKDAPFPELAKSLTDQLGMNNTWISTLPVEARAHLSTGHRDFNLQVPHFYDAGILIDGTGSTLSSARDLLTLVESMMSDRTDTNIDDDLYKALKMSLTPVAETGCPGTGVAYAWAYDYNVHEGSTDKMKVYTQTGATAGYSTTIAFQPGSQTGIIGMTNCGRGDDDIYAMADALATKLALPYSRWWDWQC